MYASVIQLPALRFPTDGTLKNHMVSGKTECKQAAQTSMSKLMRRKSLTRFSSMLWRVLIHKSQKDITGQRSHLPVYLKRLGRSGQLLYTSCNLV